jgi:hypothetical protein
MRRNMTGRRKDKWCERRLLDKEGIQWLNWRHNIGTKLKAIPTNWVSVWQKKETNIRCRFNRIRLELIFWSKITN